MSDRSHPLRTLPTASSRSEIHTACFDRAGEMARLLARQTDLVESFKKERHAVAQFLEHRASRCQAHTNPLGEFDNLLAHHVGVSSVHGEGHGLVAIQAWTGMRSLSSLPRMVVSERTQKVLSSLGLLTLRVGVGALMLMQHGLPKVQNFSQKADSFSDPLGIGSVPSLLLATFAEFGCSILVILGLLTRIACVPLIITMLVATFFVHATDPWARKEFALLYALPFIALLLLGPGEISLDRFLFGRRKKKS